MLPALNHYLSVKVLPSRWSILAYLVAAGLLPAMGFAQNGDINQQPPANTEPLSSHTEKPLQSVERAKPDWPEILKARQNLLAESRLSGQALWLDPETRSTLAFWYPHSNTTTAGSILMLHAAGQHPVWPETLRNMVEHLPRHGWNVLTIAVPDYYEPPTGRPAKAVTPTEPEQANGNAVDAQPPTAPQKLEPDPPPTRQAVEQQAARNMEAGLAFLRQKGFTSTALLGEGLGATRVLHFSADKGNNGVTIVAKLLLNLPYNQDSSFIVTDYSQLLEDIPTLDIYFDDFGLAEEAARMRATKARAVPNLEYRQTKFNAWAAPMDPSKENRLTKTIRGFLKTHQAGTDSER